MSRRPGSAGLHLLDDLPGAVGGVVVDDDDLGAGGRVAEDLLDERADIVLFVVGREDDRHIRHSLRLCSYAVPRYCNRRTGGKSTLGMIRPLSGGRRLLGGRRISSLFQRPWMLQCSKAAELGRQRLERRRRPRAWRPRG